MADNPPAIGQHLASLNLFMEADGKAYITVAGGGAVLTPFLLPGEVPMNAIARFVEEAGPRFVETWKDWKRG